MADLRTDPAFAAAVEGTRAMIQSLSQSNVPDAIAIRRRGQGENNLQGHARSVVPLAVLFARTYPHHLRLLRQMASLSHDMTSGSSEANNRQTWNPIMQDMVRLISSRGSDVIAQTLRTSTSQDVTAVATTYLSSDYAGAHTTGGAGDTVLKRTLKLIAHTLIP